MMKNILLSLYLVFIASTAWAAGMDHDSSKDCAVCHYEWMPEFVHDLKGTDIVDYQSEKVVATEKMCFSCHNGTVGDSRIRIWSGDTHQLTNKIPDYMHIPENLPLDKGKISCRTCHTAHATDDPKADGVEKGVFLRMENTDSQLCEACHTDFSNGAHPTHPFKKPEKNVAAIEKKLGNLGARFGSQGQIICQSCHTPHSPRDKELLIYPVDDSKLCSICHTDKVNPDDAAYIKGMLNHPIDIRQDNPEIVAHVKKAGGVYGKGDEVICLTCHTAHKGETNTLLIKNNAGSELCITCHDNQKNVFNGKHDMRNVAGFRTKAGKTAQEKGVCQSCHAPHGWSLELPAAGDTLSAGCLSCHQEGGFAGKKVLSAKRFNHPVNTPVKDYMKSGGLPLFPDLSKDANNTASQPESGDMVTCATCHDVHSGAENFLRIEAQSGRLCITCHTDKQMIEKTVHGPNKLPQNCLACHTVHNCENQRLLNLSENDGCLECHQKGGSAEKLPVDLSRSHPVDMLVKHQLKEPFKTTPEGRFTCVTCHDPHQSSKTDTLQKDFLRGGYTDKDAFCVACHETQKEIIGSDHDNREKSTDQACDQCHKVHNAKTATNIMAVEYPYKDRDDDCRACHNKNGSAGKKVISGGHKLGRIDHVEKYRAFITKQDGDTVIYCSSCHTVHNNGPRKGAEGTRQTSFLDRHLFEKGSFCLGCHEDKTAFAASKHNVNHFEKHTEKTEALKAEGDDCGACHTVHNSGYYLFENSLGSDFEKICTSCHSTKGLASKTSISTSHKINIKLKDNKDAFLQDGKMVCVTCHEPHARNKAMLRTADKQNLCVACHEDQKSVEYSNHNPANVAYLQLEAGKKAQGTVCATCHQPHNFDKGNRLMWAFEPGKRGLFAKKSAFAIGMCTDCHKKEGSGRKKIPEILTHDNSFKILPLKVKERFKPYLYDENGVSSINGALTCQSCHDPHVWKKDGIKPGTGLSGQAGNNGFLKQNVREKFCAGCHGMEQAKELFAKFHDKKFRESRNKKQRETEVLRNLMRIQMDMEKLQKDGASD